MLWNQFCQSCQRLLLLPLIGLVLGLGLMIFSQPTMAVAVTSGESTAAPQSTVDRSTVDQFLQSIPRGYYAVQPVEVIKAKVAAGKTLFIDIRETAEYTRGHIPGAINIPLRELAQNLERVPEDQPVILYCSTGYRTGIGVMALRLLGYENIEGFPPSYTGWKQAQSAGP